MTITPWDQSTKTLQRLAWIITMITFCGGIGIGIWRGSWTSRAVTVHVTAQPVVALWMHNASVVLLAFLGILSLGLVTWFIVLWNGIDFGYIAMVVVQRYGAWVMLGGVLPHGIFEIPADLIAFQADIFCLGTMARGVLHRCANSPDGSMNIMPALRLAAKRNLVSLAILGVAAIIEAFVTPVILQRLLH